jgi:isopentenyl diphosphate isomerase/L-lactate dehydrogenase-like FMN-dependent dehydrogenase
VSDRAEPLVNLFDYESAAASLIGAAELATIATGATDEITLRRTREAYDSIALVPRVLQDLRRLDLSTRVLGTPIGFPVMAAPAGNHVKAHRDGELATARALAAVDSVMVVSAHASFSIEQIADVTDARLWFQSYLFADRGLTRDWARRAEAAGCLAHCLTLDAQWPSKRERVLRVRATAGSDALGANYDGVQRDSAEQRAHGVVIGGSSRALTDRGATWADVERFKVDSSIPVVVKGILTAADATLAVDHGVDGLVVSNHGGRNVDTTIPTIEALPAVVDAVSGRAEVYLDGGIRRGTDVVKALALGARAVLVGRPLFWGLAVDGDRGLIRLLKILREEVESAMAICGRPTLGDLDRSVLTRFGTGLGML